MLRLLTVPLLAAGILSSCGGTPKEPDTGTDFKLDLAPPVVKFAVNGAGGQSLVTVTWLHCAPQTVDLTLAGAPAGVSSAFLPVSTSTTSVLTITPPAVTPPSVGFYHMWVQGTASDVHHQTELDLAIQDFTLTQPLDATTAPAPSTVTVPISFTRLPGELPFDGNVTLSAFTTATFIAVPPPTIVANPGTSANLTFSAAAGSPPGTYPIQITGTDPATGLTHSVTFNLTVQ